MGSAYNAGHLIAAVTVCAVLVGCATAAQRQVQKSKAGSAVAVAEFKACMTSIIQKPEYASAEFCALWLIRDLQARGLTSLNSLQPR
jgi:hypothetical protein